MRVTLVSHFYNEVFLLPWWVRHHRPMFDRAVLLDHGSTDGSADVVRTLAPHWEVRQSRCRDFAAQACDDEVMAVERECAGWKIALTTTEFLCSPDLGLYVRWMTRYRPEVRGVWAAAFAMVESPETYGGPLDPDRPLWEQRHHGYAAPEHSRLLHREPDGRYGTGRHTSPVVGRVVDGGLVVLKYGLAPAPQCWPRKLQIQARIPQSDRRARLGHQHLTDEAGLEARLREAQGRAVDLRTDPTFRECVMEVRT